jgi:hypothetical protein
MSTKTSRKLQELSWQDLSGEGRSHCGDTPVESYRNCSCPMARSIHMTQCCDTSGLEVPQEYDCTWCGRKTSRLDLDHEAPLHLECSGLRSARMLLPHWKVIRALLELFGFRFG